LPINQRKNVDFYSNYSQLCNKIANFFAENKGTTPTIMVIRLTLRNGIKRVVVFLINRNVLLRNRGFRCSTEVERDGIWEVHTLLIKDISMDDGGSYRLKATNRVGTTEETGTLSIVTEEPSFPKVLESVTTKLGCTESFEVTRSNSRIKDCGKRSENGKDLIKNVKIYLSRN
jgi:hypothetical protein